MEKIAFEFAQIVKFAAQPKDSRILCTLRVGTLMSPELALQLGCYGQFYDKEGKALSIATKTTLRRSYADWWAKLTPSQEEDTRAEMRCTSIEKLTVEEKDSGALSFTVDLKFWGKAKDWVEFWEETLGTALTVELTDAQQPMFPVADQPKARRQTHLQ